MKRTEKNRKRHWEIKTLDEERKQEKKKIRHRNKWKRKTDEERKKQEKRKWGIVEK